MWYLLSRILDSTARAKFTRQTSLPEVKWGSFFPVYTNFACIALVFSVIAPIMSIFAIINFSLLWCAHRYNMLYVTRFRTDTGGKLYPRALNQMFTGLYVMELCLVGLFFLVQAPDGTILCYKQGIIMIVAIGLTALYQVFLNREFGPLLQYLPITFEDEAVLRDEVFEMERKRKELVRKLEDLEYAKEEMKLQGQYQGDVKGELERRQEQLNREVQELKRWKSHSGENGNRIDEKVEASQNGPPSTKTDQGEYEMDDMPSELQDGWKTHKKNKSSGGSLRSKMNPLGTIRHGVTWAVEGGNMVKDLTYGQAEQKIRQHAGSRRKKFERDLENQRAIGDALFGNYADEIEDLNPEERDEKTRKAFTHSALRARRPVVWIPRDDLGVSDDEVRRTAEYSVHIRISNEGTALDSKCRVVYGQAPPDFSEEDLIQL